MLLDEYLLPSLDNVWPDDGKFEQRLLECWSEDGRSLPSLERLRDLLQVVFPWDKPPGGTQTRQRALFAACIAGEICFRRFVEAHNYVACVMCRTLLLAAAYAFADFAGGKHEESRELRKLIKNNILADLTILAVELAPLEGRDYYDDAVQLQWPYHRYRLLLVRALLSIARLNIDDGDFFVDVSANFRANVEFVDRFVGHNLFPGVLASEQLLPQLLAIYWRGRNHVTPVGYDYMIASLLGALMNSNLAKNGLSPVPDPYQALEATLLEQFGFDRPPNRTKGRAKGQAWFALALFGILVRRNLKTTCQTLFAALTTLIHRKTVVTASWAFGLIETEEAKDLSEQLTYPARWDDFVERSRSDKAPAITKIFGHDHFSLSAFVIFCPYRATEEVIFHLDEVYVGNWHPPAQPSVTEAIDPAG